MSSDDRELGAYNCKFEGDRFQIARQRVQQEDLLLNQRVTWLLAL
jgi:hypothetical protein